MPEITDPIYERNSEEITEIIGAPPSWILRRGITVIFLVILAVIAIAGFVQYPDVIKISLKVNSLNSPKPLLARQGGKLLSILVTDKQEVKASQPLAFMESTADHRQVIKLHESLITLRSSLNNGSLKNIPVGKDFNIGELQAAYQNFYQSWLQFSNTRTGGNALLQKTFMQKDLLTIEQLRKQLLSQQELQKKELDNAEEEYQAYVKLMEKGVISKLEFKQQQNKYFASKAPLQQSDAALLNNSTAYQAKQKEISDHINSMIQEQQQFLQALNSMISDTESWLQQYVIFSPIDGRVSLAGIIQENQQVNTGQELFIVNPGNTDFFGEVQIPQYNMGKIHEGQKTLVKLKSYPFEEYGMIKGRIGFLSDVAYKDSVFIAKIEFEKIENKDPSRRIVLKSGMIADAEIITEESSLLQRFTRNIRKMMNGGG